MQANIKQLEVRKETVPGFVCKVDGYMSNARGAPSIIKWFLKYKGYDRTKGINFSAA
jgi:hypothetical protein